MLCYQLPMHDTFKGNLIKHTYIKATTLINYVLYTVVLSLECYACTAININNFLKGISGAGSSWLLYYSIDFSKKN